jgi:predicted permease
MRGVWSALLADARYALRSLWHRPALTAVAVATLAIGSGAATAVFAVVNSVLLEPLPYPEADEVVAIWHDAPGAGFPLEDGGLLASASMWLTYADENRVFENIGLWTPGLATVTGDGDPEEVPRVAVTAGVLEALGVPPLLGRWFSAGDLADDIGSVILSHGYWQRHFGGDPAVVGRTLTLNGNPIPTEIVGVMPQGFRIADTDADLIIGPMRFDRASLPLQPFAYLGLARLKPGMTVADANADLARMIPMWLESWPPGAGPDARTYTDVWRIAPTVRPLKQDVVGDVGTLLWLVLATIGAVLLIACANVANLMLIRGAARQHELAIRAALGAGVARLRRATLFESVAVGWLGGLAGLALAAAGLRVLVALAPATLPRLGSLAPSALPRLGEIALDGEAIATALAVSSLAGVVVGLVAAARVGGRLNEGLHAGGRTSSAGRGQQRIQQSLVVAQVALAVVVLVGAGLSIRTADALRAVDPGFAGAEQVQTLRISMRVGQVPDPVLVARRQQEILDAVATLPGVTAVGFAGSVPMDEANRLGDTIEVEGRPLDLAGVRRSKSVSPGFFEAVGQTLLAGRDLSWADLYDGRPVVLVSENMARELWTEPGAAIGKRLRVRGDARWWEVVGVVADVREDGLPEPAPTIVYWPPLTPGGVSRSVVMAVRSDRAGTEALNREIQEAVWSVDPNLPVTWVRTLQDLYEGSLARTTFTLIALVVAACAALALGVVGLYGVLSYAVSLRRREIAIRLALGANERDVRRQFVRHGVALAAVGVAIGLATAAGVTRLVMATLYEVGPVDPLTYAAVAAGLLGVAALASYVPARRASTVDPAESLAAE